MNQKDLGLLPLLFDLFVMSCSLSFFVKGIGLQTDGASGNALEAVESTFDHLKLLVCGYQHRSNSVQTEAVNGTNPL